MNPDLRIAERILRQPTAPFHEHCVRRALIAELERLGLPWRLDRYGNLLARYKRGSGRPMAMTAHMDHPGFEVLSVHGARAEARWNGQTPPFDLKGLRLALYSSGRKRGAVVLDGDGRRHKEKGKLLALRVPEGTRALDYGHADLIPFKLSAGKIVSKALDNTAGCAAIIACLHRLRRKRARADVLALFTRAEEVGFHGAFGAIQAKTLPKSRPVVVLECSKAIPGAEQGLGPVIRVGDKMRVFDPDVVSACEAAAKASALKFQRRLMDGGTCEATAYGLAGYRAVCLAFPLGNYHNIGPEGVAEEFIAQSDFLDGVSLLAAFAVRGVDPAGAAKRLKARLDARFGKEQRFKLLATR